MTGALSGVAPAPDPVLETMTFDQLAQLIDEVSPDAFYQRAAAFDQAAARLQDVLDRIRRQLRLVQESWSSKSAEDFDAVAREVVGQATNVLQAVQNPGYGALLRRAGDALAGHQQRLRDLRGLKTQQEAAPPAPGVPTPEATAQLNDQSARQILDDLRTAYQDIAFSIAPLPETIRGPAGSGGSSPAVFSTPNRSPVPAGADARLAGDVGPVPEVLISDTGVLLAAPGAVAAVPGVLSPSPSENRGGPVLGRREPVNDVAPAGPEPLCGTEAFPSVLGYDRTVPASPADSATPTSVVVAPTVLGREMSAFRLREKDAKTGGRHRKPAEADAREKEKRQGERPVQQKAKHTADHVPDREPDKRPETVSAESGPPAGQPATPPAPTADLSTVEGLHAEAAAGELPVPATAGFTAAPVLRSPIEHAGTAVPVHGDSAVHATFVAAAPATHGMSVPGTGHGGAPDQPSVAALAEAPGSADATVPGAAPAPPTPNRPAEQAGQATPGYGGYPMSPMMTSGFQGQQSQQNGRIPNMPAGPKPELWDSAQGAPGTLGKAEPMPPDPAGQADADPVSELDRLLERGNR